MERERGKRKERVAGELGLAEATKKEPMGRRARGGVRERLAGNATNGIWSFKMPLEFLSGLNLCPLMSFGLAKWAIKAYFSFGWLVRGFKMM